MARVTDDKPLSFESTDKKTGDTEPMSEETGTEMVATGGAGILPAEMQANVLTALGGPTDIDQAAETEFVSAPYLYFHHPNSSIAGQVLAVRPEAKRGHQFIVDGEEVRELRPGWVFTTLEAIAYWAHIDNEGNHSKVTFDNPGRSPGVKKNIVSVTLIDDGDNFYPTCTTWRSTKTSAPQKQMNAIKGAKTEAWVANAPTTDKQRLRSAVASATGPAFALRVWSNCTLSTRKAKESGFEYDLADSSAREADPAQLERLQAWFKMGGAERVGQCLEAYRDRIAWLNKHA